MVKTALRSQITERFIQGRTLRLTLCAALLLVTACKRNAPPTGGSGSTGPSTSASAPANPNALPPLTLKDDTAQLMLTWVDDKGDFHVVQEVAAVPEGSRERVRVVILGQEAGTGQHVYVADLRQKNPDGSYAVRTVSRSEWDRVGADRRQARLEAMAPKDALAPAAPSSNAAGKPHAIIYGADWCKPCHQAEDFLRSLGVDVTMKNIEQSNAAQAEMQQKLAKVRRGGASIPVIDLMGNILVGFNPDVLRKLVEQKRSATAANKTL